MQLNESVFSDRFLDFISKPWTRPVEQYFIALIAKDRKTIMNNPDDGKAYLAKLLEENKARLEGECSQDFFLELTRLATEYVTERKKPVRFLKLIEELERLTGKKVKLVEAKKKRIVEKHFDFVPPPVAPAPSITYEEFLKLMLVELQKTVDTKWNYGIATRSVSSKDRLLAIQDIKTGKVTTRRKWLEYDLKKMYEEGEVDIIMGRGLHVQRRSIPIDEFFGLNQKEEEVPF
jgi:hypothetical protein